MYHHCWPQCLDLETNILPHVVSPACNAIYCAVETEFALYIINKLKVATFGCKDDKFQYKLRFQCLSSHLHQVDKTFSWNAVTVTFLLPTATLTYERHDESSVLALPSAQDATTTYETPQQLFHIDRLILTVIARLLCDAVAEEDLNTRDGPTVPIESDPRPMGYNDLVAQCVTEFLQTPQDELVDCAIFLRWNTAQIFNLKTNCSVPKLSGQHQVHFMPPVSFYILQPIGQFQVPHAKYQYGSKKILAWLLLPKALHCTWSNPKRSWAWGGRYIGQRNYRMWL